MKQFASLKELKGQKSLCVTGSKRRKCLVWPQVPLSNATFYLISFSLESSLLQDMEENLQSASSRKCTKLSLHTTPIILVSLRDNRTWSPTCSIRSSLLTSEESIATTTRVSKWAALMKHLTRQMRSRTLHSEQLENKSTTWQKERSYCRQLSIWNRSRRSSRKMPIRCRLSRKTTHGGSVRKVALLSSLASPYSSSCSFLSQHGRSAVLHSVWETIAEKASYSFIPSQLISTHLF